MNRRRTGILAALLALAALGSLEPATAQQAPQLVPGQRIRLTGPLGTGSRVTGVFSAVRGDTVVLREPRATTETTVPRDWVRSVEVCEGRRYAGAIGAGIGALCGLTICTKGPWFVHLLGGAAGAAIGALAGSALVPERWASLPLDQLRVGVAPLPDGRWRVGAALAL